jgi:hypothetical protein
MLVGRVGFFPSTATAGTLRKKGTSMATRITQQYTWSRILLQNFLKALSTIPVATLFTTPKVRLFSGATVPGVGNAVADFTAVVYSGYADVTIVPSAPVNVSPAAQGVVASPLFTSPGSGAFTPDVATGYILFDGATAYYGGERFISAVPFAAFGDFLDLTLILPLQGIQLAS